MMKKFITIVVMLMLVALCSVQRQIIKQQSDIISEAKSKISTYDETLHILEHKVKMLEKIAYKQFD